MFMCLRHSARIKKLNPFLKKSNDTFYSTSSIELGNVSGHKDDTDCEWHVSAAISVSEVRRESLLEDEVYVSEDAGKKVNMQ